jgi:putative MFS transporter
MTNAAERLERLPFSRFHRRLLLMGGLGYTFDAMDAAVIAFVLPVLTPLWHLTSVETGVLASATFIGYFFGAFCAGTGGDLLGRRTIMMGALAVYSLASLVSAFAPSWTPFFFLRIVAGFGTGAESAIVAPFLSEFVGRRYRGTFVGSLAGFFSFGFLGAALLGYALIPAASWGWQLAIVVTALPIALLLWWRRALPESPRWLESRGRQVDADRVLAAIEAEVEACEGEPLPPPAAAVQAPAIQAGTFFANLRALLSGPIARITVMTWMLWLSITFSYYAFFSWIPSLLVQSGLTVTRSFAYSVAIYAAQIPGYYSASYFNERLGRRATIVIYLLLGCAAAMGLATATSNLQVTVAGVFLSLFMNGTYAGVYAYTPEVFPTSIRATGTGVASSVGRIGAICAPILVGYLFPLFGFAGVFGMTTAALALGALAILVFGVNTKGRSLEEITAEELAGAGE